MKDNILLNDLLKTKEYQESNAILPVILGADKKGITIVNDLREMFSILVAGKSGSGKSVFINSVLKSLTYKLSDKECKFAIFSSKNTDFEQWQNDNHLLFKSDTNDCIKQFNSIIEIINDRCRILSENKVKSAIEYRKKTNNDDMPFIIVIIDDLSDFINYAHTENFIKTICENSNTVDVYIITSTNKTDTLNETLMANFITRIAFQTSNAKESESILEESGAELLLPYGEALYSWTLHLPVKFYIAH